MKKVVRKGSLGILNNNVLKIFKNKNRSGMNFTNEWGIRKEMKEAMKTEMK